MIESPWNGNGTDRVYDSRFVNLWNGIGIDVFCCDEKSGCFLLCGISWTSAPCLSRIDHHLSSYDHDRHCNNALNHGKIWKKKRGGGFKFCTHCPHVIDCNTHLQHTSFSTTVIHVHVPMRATTVFLRIAIIIRFI